jgi:hypothetical protein
MEVGTYPVVDSIAAIVIVKVEEGSGTRVTYPAAPLGGLTI